MKIPTLRIYRLIVFDFLGNQCKNCGSKDDLVVHHKDFNQLNNNKHNLILFCRYIFYLILFPVLFVFVFYFVKIVHNIIYVLFICFIYFIFGFGPFF